MENYPSSGNLIHVAIQPKPGEKCEFFVARLPKTDYSLWEKVIFITAKLFVQDVPFPAETIIRLQRRLFRFQIEEGHFRIC